MEPNWEGILRYAKFCDLAFESPDKIIDVCLSLGYVATCIEKDDNFCFVAESQDENIICFRGSDSIKDLKTDLGIGFYKTANEWQVHNGFWEAWESLKPQIVSVLNHCNYEKPFTLCGHSLGGGLAVLCAAFLSEFMTDIDVCTFGCPRVGRGKWKRLIEERIENQKLIIINIVNYGDVIPSIPWVILGWRTVGETIKVGSKKKWYSLIDRVRAHPILRYVRNILIKTYRK